MRHAVDRVLDPPTGRAAGATVPARRAPGQGAVDVSARVPVVDAVRAVPRGAR